MTEASVRNGLDLGPKLSIHIVGIGGAGMRAIGLVLATMGHSITGRDLKLSLIHISEPTRQDANS